jgi:signal transduction histidine kinase
LTKTAFYASRRKLYRFDTKSRKNEVLLDLPDGYFQSLLWSNNKLWVANSFKVLLLNRNKVQKEFDLVTQRRFITALSPERDGGVWLTIPGLSQAYKIEKDFTLQHYTVPLGKEGVINIIHEGNDGTYIASSGSKSYFFYKSFSDSIFKNISLPITFALKGQLEVRDFVNTGNMFWLATSEGLFLFDKKAISKVYLGPRFTHLAIKSIATYPGNRLLISNSWGLLVYDIGNGNINLYNESYGLPSRTIPRKGIVADKANNIWIGTSRGLCFSEYPLTDTKRTGRPKIIKCELNGKLLRNHEDLKINAGDFLSVSVSPITFPEEDVLYHYRLLPQKEWLAGKSEVRLVGLPAGSHTLEIRARKNGPYLWSEPVRLVLVVDSPYWAKPWFFIGLAACVMVVVLVTTQIVSIRNRALNRKLKNLIDIQTLELRQSNEELRTTNQEKDNLVALVAHDLKAPLAQIIGLIELTKIELRSGGSINDYIDKAGKSALRLREMIHKILNSQAIEAKQMNAKMERVDFSGLLQTISDRYVAEADKKGISIIRQIEGNIYVSLDETYASQVLDNLLSNAIKFSPFNRRVFVVVRKEGSKAICEIRDEGPGFTEEDKKKLFGKFQKLSARPTGDESSTGVGLSIAKRLVTVMKGKIWVVSESGIGASFFVEFPCDEPS